MENHHADSQRRYFYLFSLHQLRLKSSPTLQISRAPKQVTGYNEVLDFILTW